MRPFVFGSLTETLVGCSCLRPPQTVMEACMDPKGLACFKAVASQPIEPKPASFKANSAPIKAKTAIAEKTEKPRSDDDHDRPHLATKTAKSALAAAKVEPPASGQAAEPSDPVITVAKTEIAPKTEKSPSDDERDKAHLATRKAKSSMAAAKFQPPGIGQPHEPSDPRLTKRNTATAGK